MYTLIKYILIIFNIYILRFKFVYYLLCKVITSDLDNLNMYTI